MLKNPQEFEAISAHFCIWHPFSCKGEGAGGEGSLKPIDRAEMRGSIRSTYRYQCSNDRPKIQPNERMIAAQREEPT